jgi:hypothetical protein
MTASFACVRMNGMDGWMNERASWAEWLAFRLALALMRFRCRCRRILSLPISPIPQRPLTPCNRYGSHDLLAGSPCSVLFSTRSLATLVASAQC